MNPSADEVLTRFASRLAADYAANSNYTPLSIGGSASALPYFLSTSSSLEQNCSLPCLSLRCVRRLQKQRDNQQRNQLSEFLDRNNGELAGSSSSNDDYPQLLSRVSRFGKHSIALAPSSLLRNLLCSFGHMLELKLQRTIFYLMQKQQYNEERNNQKSEGKQHKNQESKPQGSFKRQSKSSTSQQQHEQQTAQDILKSFAQLSSSSNSAIAPISASTNFCTMLPVTEWSKAGPCHDRISMSLVFEAEIQVKVPPKSYCQQRTEVKRSAIASNENISPIIFTNNKNNIVTARMRAPGSIIGMFKDGKSRPESIQVIIDTDELYNNMKKECRYISKFVVSAVIGPSALDCLRSRRKSANNDNDNIDNELEKKSAATNSITVPVSSDMKRGILYGRKKIEKKSLALHHGKEKGKDESNSPTSVAIVDLDQALRCTSTVNMKMPTLEISNTIASHNTEQKNVKNGSTLATTVSTGLSDHLEHCVEMGVGGDKLCSQKKENKYRRIIKERLKRGPNIFTLRHQ